MKTVGLSMIVKNEAHTIRQCLESVQGVVSQIVVADTGSTDDTVAIAKEMGATVISIPWTNHYAEARNAALKPMKTDWILSLDADEELDAESKPLIKRLIRDRNVTGGYMCQIRQYMKTRNSRHLERLGTPNDMRHPRASNAPCFHLQNTIRLFRRSPDIYYFGRIHELVEYRISLLGLKLEYSPVLIHHFGQLEDEEGRVEKHKYYRELGQLKVKDEPDNPFAWFELGLLEYTTFSNFDAALTCFEQTVKIYDDFPRAWQLISVLRLQKGMIAESLHALQQIKSTAGMVGEIEHQRGDILYTMGQLNEARDAYRVALQESHGDPLLRSQLGLLEVRLGNAAEGIELLEKAIEDAPYQVDPHDRLVKAHIIANNMPAAAEAAERFAGYILHPKTVLRAASIRAHMQQYDRANEILKVGLRFFPDAPELQEIRAAFEQKAVPAGV